MSEFDDFAVEELLDELDAYHQQDADFYTLLAAVGIYPRPDETLADMLRRALAQSGIRQLELFPGTAGGHT